MSEDHTRKILIYHDSQEYLYQEGETIILRGQEAKEADGRLIKDYHTCLKEFCMFFLSQFFEHIVVLSAAGTSICNGENRGKDRLELWNACMDQLSAIEKEIDPVKLSDKPFWMKKDLEAALSYIDAYQRLEVKNVDAEINKIKEIIRNDCDLTLDSQAPHEEFLRKITARKVNSSRVQLFTTNYDTLWEQAASNAGFTIIDGFSFSHPRKFSGRYFDIDIVNREKTRIKNEDNFIPNVIHLYKLHGSLDWKQEGENIIQTTEGTSDALMIYPVSNKYESSYKQPYFEMMSRFQQSLRRDNVLLLIMGFGFQDLHIGNMIVEAVKQNPSLHLIILDYNKNESIDVERYKTMFLGAMSKITIIFGSFEELTDFFPVNQVYQEEIHEKHI